MKATGANQQAKAALRAAMLSRRAALDAGTRARMGGNLVLQLMRWQAWQQADWLGLFAAMPEEVPMDVFGRHAAETGVRMMYPAYDTQARIYRYRGWKPGDPWQVGRWNIPEPAGEAFVALTGHVVLLVPGLAFDRCGRRIGYGAGYYDRMLAMAHATADTVTSVGVCFPFQVCEQDVPEGPHDQRVQALATGTDWIDCE